MDDVSVSDAYPTPIPAEYNSREYPKIKLYLKKNNCPILFR